MKIKNYLIATAIVGSVMITNLSAADAFSADQQQQIEKIIHNYLVKNPEVLVEASQVLQQKQQQTMQQQAQSAIQENANQLFNDQWTSVGNPKGNVTLVEFFDYQCGHCKKMNPIINDLIKNDKNLKVVYKEFPIFGKESELASRAAIAAAMQGKYNVLHELLMNQDKRLDEASIMEMAKSAGLDSNRLKTDMNSSAVTKILDDNRQLAEKLHLMGTPAFVIGATPNGEFKNKDTAFIPGAATEQALQDLIKKAATDHQ